MLSEHQIVTAVYTAKGDADKTDDLMLRLVESLKTLPTGEKQETVIDVDRVLHYFMVQVFGVNMDSYPGKTGHNYYLYEKDGVLQILARDYNLALTAYSLGMPEPVHDSPFYVNYPINKPASGEGI